jgi:phage gp16-like protein
MLAKIHIAKKDLMVCTACPWLSYSYIEPWGCPQCGSKIRRQITELDYRAFLRRLTGKTSCADMNKFELESVLFALRSAGFVDTKRTHISRAGNYNKKGMAKKAEEKARLVLGRHWEARLNGWIKKAFGVDSAYFLTPKQLRAVFGFLHKVKQETEPF